MKTIKMDSGNDIEFIVGKDNINPRNCSIPILNDEINTTFGQNWAKFFLFSV